MERYAALVSGGVDSSLALHQLLSRRDGGSTADVTAYYLKIWLEDELSFLGSCPWEEDLSYARRVCDHLGVPLEVVPLQEEYYQRVVSYTLSELRAGRTPSPDIFCNQRIKFGAFLEAVQGESWAGQPLTVVTGHYARTAAGNDGLTRLYMAPDAVKDQTYFLSHLSQSQVQQALFPLGAMTKSEVRQRAAELDLATRDRPDSQGICFLGRIRYSDFVRHYLGEADGPILEHESGRELGRHRGAWFYTIGQRQGLGLGNGPWYVVSRDVTENVVRVSHRENVDGQARARFTVGELSAVATLPGTWPGRKNLHLKLRHGPDLIPCRLSLDGPAPADRFAVEMERPDRGVAAGQYAVFYDPPECLGTGRILSASEESAGGAP